MEAENKDAETNPPPKAKRPRKKASPCGWCGEPTTQDRGFCSDFCEFETPEEVERLCELDDD